MATSGFNDGFLTRLKQAEGYRQFPYKDAVGVLTIGYGLNLGSDGLSPLVAEFAMVTKLAELRSKFIQRFPWFQRLDSVRQEVLLEIAYNVGFAGACAFKNMLAAVEKHDYDKAAAELLDSDAARKHEQWGSPRYKVLAELMKEGE